MVKRNVRKRDLEQQMLVNKRTLEEKIRICQLREKLGGNTEAAKEITATGQQIRDSTVRQIYVTYQVFLASEIIQKLFYSGMISWNDIYSSRGIYDRSYIRRDRLIDLENNLLYIAGIDKKKLGFSAQDKEYDNGEIGLQVYKYENLDEYYQILQEKVIQSKLDASSRRERLKTASKKPDILEITHRVFKRNPDVIAEVLERAKGFCERCEKAAPFVRKSDKTPFLEVHHRIPLAEGGEDTVENAVALCPNCHREMHYGFLS